MGQAKALSTIRIFLTWFEWFIVVPPPCGGWKLYFITHHPHAYAWGYSMSPSARAE